MTGPVLAAAGSVAAMAVLVAVDPNEPGHYPLCPFRALTGLDCPGCGTLRALHDLGTGDLRGAVDHNVLAVVTLPLLLLAWVAWARRSWTGDPRRTAYPPWLPRLALVVVLAWWVVRNIPALGYLASG